MNLMFVNELEGCVDEAWGEGGVAWGGGNFSPFVAEISPSYLCKQEATLFLSGLA